VEHISLQARWSAPPLTTGALTTKSATQKRRRRPTQADAAVLRVCPVSI